jgi:hypothetical protein
VQTAHATLELGLQLKEEKKPKETSFLILLDAKDQDHLKEIACYLDDHGIEHHMFFEPDEPINGYTALCSEPVTKNQRKLFSKYKLWSM